MNQYDFEKPLKNTKTNEAKRILEKKKEKHYNKSTKYKIINMKETRKGT